MSGPIDYFERYLWRHGCDTIRIDHPLDSYTGRSTYLRHNGRRIREWKRTNFGPFSLLWDFMCTLVAALRVDAAVAVGANNFDTFSIMAARRIHLSRSPRVIYFAADYSEDRFTNPLMNWIYLQVERSVLRHADVVVSNTRRAEDKRLKLGLDRQRSLVIPNGVRLERPAFSPKRTRKDRFVFVGSVTREHGLYELVMAIKPLISSLAIIGHGEDWGRVLGLCQRLHIAHEVHSNWPHERVLEYLRDFEGFGLAPYNRDSKWTYYCSPLKINEYIATGVPVITSSVPEIADTIRAERLGIVYEAVDLEEIRQSLDAFDTTDFHLRAEQFYANYNSDALYDQVSL
jgi:glycosyltransferase involved in cell wall biosynthesis